MSAYSDSLSLAKSVIGPLAGAASVSLCHSQRLAARKVLKAQECPIHLSDSRAAVGQRGTMQTHYEQTLRESTCLLTFYITGVSFALL